MYATALLVLGALSAGQTTRPTLGWLTNYAEAQEKAIKEQRPLAVFFGSGRDGFRHVNREGKLAESTERLLAENYVCVFLDVAAPSNRSLVTTFAIKSGKGLVLSDRSGDHQAFHHDGDLSAAQLTEVLQRHGPAPPAANPAPAAKYVSLTAANFDVEVLKSKQPVLVDFYADWCGPCQRMGPVVAELGADFRGRAKVGKLNTDQAAAITSRYGITAIPAFLIFRDGEVVDRLVGSTSKTELASRLNAVINK